MSGCIRTYMVDEYTGKYDYIHSAVLAAEEIRQGEDCTSERIGYIRTGQLVLNDMTGSTVKDALQNLFENVIKICDGNENRPCEIDPKSIKEGKRNE